MDKATEKLIVFENQGELCRSVGERLLNRIDFLTNSKSELAIADAAFYNQLLSTGLEGFEGMYIFEENPSQGISGMIETVTLVPLSEKSWGFIVDAQQINENSDVDLVLALLDESIHAKQRLEQIKKDGRLSPVDKLKYEENEINARLHVIDVYRELSKEGFRHEVYENLVKLIDLKTAKTNIGKENVTREIVKDFLVRCGYKFD